MVGYISFIVGREKNVLFNRGDEAAGGTEKEVLFGLIILLVLFCSVDHVFVG